VSPDDVVLDPNDHGKYFTEEEATHLLQTVEQQFPQWYVFVLAGLQAGLRMGELAALRYEHVNWRQRYLHVRSNFVQGKFSTPKNRSTRTVNISKRLNALLRLRWREHRDSTRLIFPNETGGPIDVKLFRRRAWQRIMDAAGFDYRQPKAMRHSHTTHLLMLGEPIAWVAAQSGRSIAETERTYYHFLPRDARGGAEALAKRLEGTSDKSRVFGGNKRQPTATNRSEAAS
jgi:integrase